MVDCHCSQFVFGQWRKFGRRKLARSQSEEKGVILSNRIHRQYIAISNRGTDCHIVCWHDAGQVIEFICRAVGK